MSFDWFEHGLALLSLGQASCQHGDSLRWGEIDYFLQIRQLNHDIIGNIREEIQDIYEKDERILDTELVVVTLMLGIGFGFSVEGTFPQNDDGCEPWCQLVDFFRNCYAFCAAMSLACPFLSMLGFLECRRRLNVFMRLFNHYVYQLLRRQNTEANRLATDPGRMVENASQNAHGLTERHESWRRFRFTPDKTITGLLRRAGCCSRRKGSLNVDVAPLLQEEEPPVEFHVPVEYFSVADDYHNWFDAWVVRWKKVSRMLLFAGVFFNVLCTAILLGLYFSNAYPHTMTWLIYSGTLVISLVLAVMLLVRGFQHGPRSGEWAKHDMPGWATKEFLAGVRSS